MKVVVAGATGFIGQALMKAGQEKGWVMVGLTRKPAIQPFPTVVWDPSKVESIQDHINQADAVVSLVGENVAGQRWSESFKQKLWDSRMVPTRTLAHAIRSSDQGPKVWISASAIGIYGTAIRKNLDEGSKPGHDFLAKLCSAWEGEALLVPREVKTTVLRIGLVLGPNGGLLQRLRLPFSLGLGGPVGSGEQGFPWVHREDVVNIILKRISGELDLPWGPVNAVGPQSCSMKDFAKAYGKVLGRPAVMPVPPFAIRAMMGEGAEAVLGGGFVVPRRLQDAGYGFIYPTIHEALSKC